MSELNSVLKAIISKKKSANPCEMKNSLYLCKVRLSSEGANNLLLQQYSSWTFLTPIRGHSHKGYVLCF